MLRSQKPKGSVLVFALIILSMLLISAVTVITVSVIEKKSAFDTQRSVLAFQAADSGAERVIQHVYRNNSPSLTQVPLSGDMGSAANPNGGNTTLSGLAGTLSGNTTSPTCDSTKKFIGGTNNEEPVYAFRITFYDSSNAAISCSDAKWRDEVIKIKSEGFYRGTSRVIEIGIRPRT